MTNAWPLTLLAQGVLACSGAQPSQACSDKAYAALVAQCVAEAVSCRQSGGSEIECGPICDAKADDWALRCGQ